MIYMLCRNRVADFSRWRAVFASHEAAHKQAGLRLISLRREMEDQNAGVPNNVFFVFEVESIEKAQKFINDPEAAKSAAASGMIDGEYHFVEDAGGYR